MPEHAEFLFALGVFLLLGLAADAIGRRTLLPRVTLILLCGIVIGDEVLGLIPTAVSSRFGLITDMALMMVGFLLGGRLHLKSLRDDGSPVIWISVTAALATTVLVIAALTVLGLPLGPAILLGCVAAATAPAATLDTVLEYGGAGRFPRLLTAIVAIDDVWALLLFSFGLATVSLLNGESNIAVSLGAAGYEISGAVLLGTAIGIPAAFLTGRVRSGQPMLTEALGLVLACGGLALWLEVSYLIATMTMGALIANLARHHEYPFHEIENIEWPIMVIFFMLAGATLEIDAFGQISSVAAVFLLARITGKLLGAWGGARLSGAGPAVERWMGIAMLPQAGVAIGMALIAASRFPEFRHIIMTVVIGTTVVFEVIGPVSTRLALGRAARLDASGAAEKGAEPD